MTTKESAPVAVTGELPEKLVGHWDSADGAVLARAYLDRDRSTLCKSDTTDMALANAIFMAGRSDLDLMMWQTAAKERIRWLSAQLAAALAQTRTTMPDAVEFPREAIARLCLSALFGFEYVGEGSLCDEAERIFSEPNPRAVRAVSLADQIAVVLARQQATQDDAPGKDG